MKKQGQCFLENLIARPFHVIFKSHCIDEVAFTLFLAHSSFIVYVTLYVTMLCSSYATLAGLVVGTLACCLMLLFSVFNRRQSFRFPSLNDLRQSVRTTPQELKTVSLASDCRGIIDGSYLTPKCNKYELLEARALPNKRLERYFGIQNTFTSPNSLIWEKFRKDATDMIRLDDSGWLRIRDIAQSHLKEELKFGKGPGNEPGPKSIRLVPLMQALTLRVVLALIGRQTPGDAWTAAASIETLRKLAATINTTWVHSKSADMPNKSIEANKSDLLVLMSDALPASFGQTASVSGTANPMNFILPAYESMWRVVLHCFLEVRERSHRAHDPETRSRWLRLLQDFLRHPTHDQLKARFQPPRRLDQKDAYISSQIERTGNSEPSKHQTPNARGLGGFQSSNVENGTSDETALAIVKEALRLYSPTKRIYRQYSVDPLQKRGFHPAHGETPTLFAADIEACQRQPLPTTLPDSTPDP